MKNVELELGPLPVGTVYRHAGPCTNITLDDATGSLDAASESAGYFGLSGHQAAASIERLQAAVAGWRSLAQSVGASPKECRRMQSAFLPPS